MMGTCGRTDEGEINYFAVVVAPAVALSGMPFVSRLVVSEDGEQLSALPDVGFVASLRRYRVGRVASGLVGTIP